MIDVSADEVTGITTITLDRPPVNALTVQACADLRDAFNALRNSPGARCVLLTSRGTRAFCAGLDLREFFSSTDDESGRAMVLREMYGAVQHCLIPVIAAIEAPALGAGSILASLCDIRVAAHTATFGLPEVNVGRIGGAAHHSRFIPPGVLRRMVFSGLPISAEEAHRVGFVDELVSSDALVSARALASVIGTKSIVGLRHAKQSLNEIEYLSAEEGYAREQATNIRLRQTQDAQEASRAVIEKRAPVFTGR